MDKNEDIHEGILARDENQLILIYNSNTQMGKEARGYVDNSEDPLLAIDIAKTNLGDTVWVDIAAGVGCPLSELLSPEHPEAPDVEDEEYSTDDWLKILNNSPDIFQKPIIIKGDRFRQLSTPSEALQFIEVDSAGLEKNGLGEPPTTQATTDGENFVED